MKRLMITSVLLIVLAVSVFAQSDQITVKPCDRQAAGITGTGGYATFDVSPIMSQIFGRAGNTITHNDVQLILQGYSGVAWLSAPVVDLNYTQLNLNNKTVTFGPPDSGGPGFRVLVVPN
jgi:opacity protein-like surface antigen